MNDGGRSGLTTVSSSRVKLNEPSRPSTQLPHWPCAPAWAPPIAELGWKLKSSTKPVVLVWVKSALAQL